MSQPGITREPEGAFRLDPQHMFCAIPRELVNGDVTLCAGVMFELTGEDTCAITLLTEADVEALTSPEASGV